MKLRFDDYEDDDDDDDDDDNNNNNNNNNNNTCLAARSIFHSGAIITGFHTTHYQDYNVGPDRTENCKTGDVVPGYERQRAASQCGNDCIRLLNCCYFELTGLPHSQSLRYKP